MSNNSFKRKFQIYPVDEREYSLVIEKHNDHYTIIMHNGSASVSYTFSYDGDFLIDPGMFFVKLTPEQDLYVFDSPIFCIYSNYIMVNLGDTLKIYDAETLLHKTNIITQSPIKGIKVTNQHLILDHSAKNNNGTIYYQYELYNFKFDHISTINKKMTFVNNGKYDDNFLVLFDDKIAGKVTGKYYLYDAEENTYISIGHEKFNLNNGMIYANTYKLLTIIDVRNGFDCAICLDPIRELHTLVPCGHTNVCAKCYNEQDLAKCPICRKEIVMQIKNFM